MKVCTVAASISPFTGKADGFDKLRQDVLQFSRNGATPLRLVVTAMEGDTWQCEVDSLQPGDDSSALPSIESIFAFRERRCHREHTFNAAMLIPTGADCAIGGHAGDATPAARLLASVCDQLIVHPNVVNASDINEQTQNCLYVEGSVITRLLMGTVALRKKRSNRILVVTEDRGKESWVVDQTVNSTNSARATLGADCRKVIVLNSSLAMRMSESQCGRAVGEVEGVEALLELLARERANYDAVALSTRITPGEEVAHLFEKYFGGNGPNPWGGVEATLTHLISAIFGVPSAHAPTLEQLELRTHNYGRVDPRKAAETISTSYMFCILKGLHAAPALVLRPEGTYDPSLLSAEDISCLVVPQGCVGLPVLAAIAQGIPVIEVAENSNLMHNDLSLLPFRPEQHWCVGNFLEAAGLIAAMKAGVHPGAVRRPLSMIPVEEF